MKKTLAVLLLTILVTTLVGCGAKTTPTAPAKPEEKKTIVLGATPVPAGEILREAKPLLEKKGYTVELKEFTDYIIPNTSLNEKQIDANLFQHTPYLENFNKEKGTDLVAVTKVYLPPIGVYSNKIKKLEDLKDGAKIAVPNDATNEKRALKLLEQAGLIKVKDSETVTILDITENKKNFVFTELKAAQLPRALEDVDAAAITANYAMDAKLTPGKDSLYLESKDSPYSNILAVRKEDKDKQFVKDLVEVLNSAKIKKFIEDKYQGSVIPTF